VVQRKRVNNKKGTIAQLLINNNNSKNNNKHIIYIYIHEEMSKDIIIYYNINFLIRETKVLNISNGNEKMKNI